MSGKKKFGKSPAPGKSGASGKHSSGDYAYGSQLDADSIIEVGPESVAASDTPSKPAFNQSAKSPRAKKQKSASKASVNFGDRIVGAANNETNAHYSANRELDALEYMARAQGIGPEGESKDSLIISTGNMTKNGKTINYMIREYDKKCYCLQLYVPLTDQKWMVFVPLTESLSELLHVWERSRTSPDQLAKLGAWLLSCTTLEFDADNYLIVAAFFDHKTFREKYVTRIMDALAGEHNLSPSSPSKGADGLGQSQGPFSMHGNAQGEQGPRKQWFRTRDSSPDGFIRTPSVAYQTMSTPNYHPTGSTETPVTAHSAAGFNRSGMESSDASASQESSFVVIPATNKKKDAMKEQKELMMRTYLGSKGLEGQMGVVARHSSGRDPNSKSTSATTSHPGYNPRSSTALQQYISSQMTKKELKSEIVGLKAEISEVFDSFHGQIMQLRSELMENSDRQMQQGEIQEQLIRLSGRSNAELLGQDGSDVQALVPLEGSQAQWSPQGSLAPLGVDAPDSFSNIAASFSVGGQHSTANAGVQKSASKQEMDTLKGDLLMLMNKMGALEEILQQNVRAQTGAGAGAGGTERVPDPLRDQYQAELSQLLELKRNFSGNLGVPSKEVRSVQSGNHSLLKDRDGSLLAVDGVSVDKSTVKAPESVYKLTKPPKPRRSKYTKPYAPTVAVHIIQSLVRAFLFYKHRADANGSATNTGWVRECTITSVLSTTREYYIICSALRFCLTSTNLILVRKTLMRLVDIIAATDSYEVVTSIPLDLIVRVLGVFVHVPLITELGYDVFAVLCKAFEERATNNVASWSTSGKKGSGLDGEDSTIDIALSANDTKVQDSLMASGGCEFVVNTLDEHIADPKLCFKGVKCIYLMCNSNANVKTIFSTAKCMKMLAKVTNKHKLNQSVVEGVLRAICAVGEDDFDNKNLMAVSGLLTAVINCCKYHFKSERSLMLFTRTITTMVENHEQNQLGSSGPTGTQLYSDMLVHHAPKGRMVDKIIFLVQAHYKDNEAAKRNLIDNGFVNAIKSVIDSPDCHHRALMAVYTLSPHLLCSCWHTHRSVIEDMRMFLNQRIENYRNSPETKRMILYCLAKFSEAEQQVVKVTVGARAVVGLQAWVRSYLLRKKLLAQREVELRPLVLESNDMVLLKEALVVTNKLKSKALGARLLPKLLSYLAEFDGSLSGGVSMMSQSLDQLSTDTGVVESELQFLEQLEFFGADLIMSTIIKLIDDPIILSSALDLVIYFGTKAQTMTRKNEKVVYRILNIGGMSAFCKAALNAYISDAKVCFKFSKLLLLFCNRSELFRAILGEADFVRLICRVLRSFQNDPSVLENMMRVVYEVAVDSVDIRTVLGDNGMCAALVDLLAIHHGLQRLVNGICKAICAMCMESHANNQTRMLGETAYAKTFVTAIVSNRRNNKINDQIYWCVFSITSNHPLNMHIFAKAGLFHAMARMLWEDEANEVIVNQTIWALFKIAPNVKAGYEGIDQKLATLLQKHAESVHATTRANASKALRVIFDGIKSKKKEKEEVASSVEDGPLSPRTDAHAAKLSALEATHAPDVPKEFKKESRKESRKETKKEKTVEAPELTSRRLDSKSTNDALPDRTPVSGRNNNENRSIADVPATGQEKNKSKKEKREKEKAAPESVKENKISPGEEKSKSKKEKPEKEKAAPEPVKENKISPAPSPASALKPAVEDKRKTHKDKSVVGEGSVVSEPSTEIPSTEKSKKLKKPEPASEPTATATATATAAPVPVPVAEAPKKEKSVSIAEDIAAGGAESSSRTSRPQSNNPWSGQQTPKSSPRTRPVSDSARAASATGSRNNKTIGEDAFDGGEMFASGGETSPGTFGTGPENKVGGGPIEDGMNQSSTSTLSKDEAVLILQRNMSLSVNSNMRAKSKQSNAGASWVRETALLRIMQTTEDFDILGEALRVAVSNSSISLSRKTMVRLVQICAPFIVDPEEDKKKPTKSSKKSTKSPPADAQTAARFAEFTKTIRCELLVGVLRLFLTDVAVSEASFVLFSILFKKIPTESALMEQRRIDSMVDSDALEMMMGALKLHDTDAKVCYKCLKTLVSIAELKAPLKTRAVLCTATNIKILTKIINKHKKNGTICETSLRLIHHLVTDHTERSQLVGENNIVASLLTAWQYHAPGNLRVTMTTLKLITSLTVGSQTINQEIFGNDLPVKLLVDSVSACRQNVKLLGQSFGAIQSVCGKHEPTKSSFFALGLIETVMDIIKENSDKDVTLLCVVFASRMVVANKNPDIGGGNAPETTRLISLLKSMSEDTSSDSKNSAAVRGECVKALSRIYGRSSTGQSTRGSSAGGV